MTESSYIIEAMEAIALVALDRVDTDRATRSELSAVLAITLCGVRVVKAERFARLRWSMQRDLEVLAFVVTEYLPALEVFAAGLGIPVRRIVRMEALRAREAGEVPIAGMSSSVNAGTPSQAEWRTAALALADALAFVLRAEGEGLPSAAFLLAVAEIERGTETSVETMWPIIEQEVASALPKGDAGIPFKNFTCLGLEKRVSRNDLPVIDAACELLGRTLGGEVSDYRHAWGKF